LHADPEFEADLACAEQEHVVALKRTTDVSQSCKTRLSR
jgi:hypothetical protein